MHKHIPVHIPQTINFGPNSPVCPQTGIPPRFTPPQLKNFRFEMSIVYSGLPPPPQLKNFKFEMTKVYSGLPPPTEKLQIWDDQSLLWFTPPPTNWKTWESYVETNL